MPLGPRGRLKCLHCAEKFVSIDGFTCRYGGIES